jgi:catechol 2,3-dioxygenase-like lactoylglutathione lyase family enzyme
MNVDALRTVQLSQGTRPALPFGLGKIGHVALYVSDIERSTRFYVDVLGFSISDIYGDDMMPGGAIFLRCNPDHHGIALFEATEANRAGAGLHHMAFEVATLDEVVRAREHLRRHNVAVDFDGRRRAGVQIAVEFRDPDGHRLEIYWGIDQIPAGGQARPAHEWKGASSLEAAIADPVAGQDTRLRDPALLRE